MFYAFIVHLYHFMKQWCDLHLFIKSNLI